MDLDLASMQVSTDDITVAWGQQPHPLDSQYGKWRMAVFQDLQESIDQNKLYFAYDPIADEQSGTSGIRKGYPGLIVFDVNLRCFVGEIALHNPGNVRMVFSLKCPSPQGGSSLVLVTEEKMYGDTKLHMFRIDLSADGLSITNSRSILSQPITMGGEYICSLRDDTPEIVVLANPGLQVWRINCMVESPQSPTAYFTVPGADLSHFSDGFLSNGSVVLLSAFADGHLDNSRVHVLSLDNQGQINTHNCTPDPQRGMPSPRKQCGMDSVTNAILFAGGEYDQGGYVQRLVDYWVLDTRTFQWTQILAQMPCPLIEPRLTVCNSGNIFLWGDFDQPLPGMPSGGTHLRILKVTGMEKAGHPPSYQQSMNQPAYPTLIAPGPTPPYPSQPYGQAPPYPSYDPNQGQPVYGSGGGYPQQGYGQPTAGHGQPTSYGGAPYGGSQPAPNASGYTAHYPPQKSKKDCLIM